LALTKASASDATVQDVGADHARSLPVRNLDCRLTDRPRRPGDQNGLSSLDRRGVNER
jgi:hypothetical protein